MNQNNQKPRVRFAPSPTGLFHLGSARTALFNYLFSKKNNADFILRIEDTDTQRSQKKYEDNILESLDWLGISYNEGPYRQSERADIYKKYIEKILEEGIGYPCFCTTEELEAEKQKQVNQKIAPIYNQKCRNISVKEAKERMKNEKYVIRIKTEEGTVSFVDKIRGEVSFNEKMLGDFVLAKGKDKPLYNLACAIDDYEMKITDVIRGEDHISNTPKQVLIQKYLNFNQLNYAHLPLILAPDKSKMSKRFGAVSVSEYKEKGFLPEAMTNFLALLGWSPGNDQEFFTFSQLEQKFSIERCKKAGAVFNIKKLEYINSLHIRNADLERLTKLAIFYLISAGYLSKLDNDKYLTKDKRTVNFEIVKEIVSENRDRIKTVSEIVDFSDYFLDKIEVDLDLLKWKDTSFSDIKKIIDKSIEIISNIDNWEKEVIYQKLLDQANKVGDRGSFLWPVRVALTGKKKSSGPFETAFILGKEETIKRLSLVKEKL